MGQILTDRGLAFAIWCVAMAAQVSGYNSTAIALGLIGLAAFFAVAPICHHVNVWHKKRKAAGSRTVEPSNLLLLGFGGIIVFAAIGLAGVMWQSAQSAQPARPDPKIAELQSQVDGLQKKLALEQAALESTKAGREIAPPPITESRLRLHFRPENTAPSAEELLNIQRWYALNDIHDSKAWTLFITLEKPMNVAQIRVESNENLPRYDVKDSDGRSAIIAFAGPIASALVDIRLLGTSDKVAPRLEPPIPPAPRQLSPYEAELKLRAIDKVLKILSRDMQTTIDKFPILQGWWNALKDPGNNPNFRSDLVAFRDEFKEVALKLDNLRNEMPEYQDLIGMAQQTAYNRAVKAIERYMIQFMYVQDTVKKDASKEALLAFMDDSMTDYHNSLNEFVAWRNGARSNILELRRRISP